MINKISNFFYTVFGNVFSFRLISKKDYNELNHFRDSNIGLYAIDQNPKDVTYKWILENNSEIT
ncbi:hypothetical protein [Polaribacter glomeratus]|uniref:Uncharacterized protein n=1 Tax=Polaribacter glomeratus TaxID=102 RepID=A0A2S7WYW1_9FLAO|nr:hypothetical protein [Polaribacter glomeratus]PQJ82706.1 hypothetical protein BTO16_09010 [Polaribacter glomeratus]TXD63733.1 hypothetical protein ESX12_17145 [Polaribacter glomeratus]